jgi:hypothetical protein
MAIMQKFKKWLGIQSPSARLTREKEAFEAEYEKFERQYAEFKRIAAQIGNPRTLETIKAELMSDGVKLIPAGDKRFDAAMEHYIASGEGLWALLDAAHAQGVRQAIDLINRAEEGDL